MTDPIAASGSPPPAQPPVELSTGAIVDAAVAVARTESLEDLSLRKVARHLGRAPMSLYRHISDVEHLRALVADRLISDVDLVDHGPDWRRTLTDAAFAMRDLLTDHPGLLPVVMRSGMTTPAMLCRIDLLVGALMRVGLTPTEVVRAHASLLSLIFGGAVLQRSLHDAFPGSSDAAVHEHFVGRLATDVDGAYPHVAAVSQAWGAMDADDPFRFAVDRLLDGIAARGGAADAPEGPAQGGPWR